MKTQVYCGWGRIIATPGLRMKQIPLLLALALCVVTGAARGASVAISYRQPTPQAAYAAKRLGAVLSERGYVLRKEQSGADYRVNLDVDANGLKPEAFSIRPEGRVITISGGDRRGMIYGALAVAESLRNGIRLEEIRAADQSPSLEFRAIKYNLPWDTYRPSPALDQHYATARDLKYWEAFLDMMMDNRFNTITLWNLHPFTYMVRPKNFPEASPWSPQELAQWQHLYHGILRMAKERGLDTYIVFWSIFVSRELAQAHNLAKESFYPHYFGPGDTSDVVRRYLRESVKQVLQEYPDLDGIGVSHGEGMAGMTPLQRQQWVDDVLLAGMLDAHRPVKLIHRVPFSSGTSSDPGVGRDVEQVTRTAIERLGNRVDGPIWVEIKFNWSHGHSTPRCAGESRTSSASTLHSMDRKTTWEVISSGRRAISRHWTISRRCRRRWTGGGRSSGSGCSTSCGAGCSTIQTRPIQCFRRSSSGDTGR
jgi:hypothetical protein